MTIINNETDLKNFIMVSEGNIPVFYKDSLGLITIGIGTHCNSFHEFITSRNVRFELLPGIKSSKTINALALEDYQNIERNASNLTLDQQRNIKTYINKHKLKTRIANAQELFNAEYNRAVELARLFVKNTLAPEFSSKSKEVIYNTFDELPSNAQFALTDMAYNMGFNNSIGFPSKKKLRRRLNSFATFHYAIKTGDWKEAAKQSKRKNFSDSHNRNSTIFFLLYSCDKDQILV